MSKKQYTKKQSKKYNYKLLPLQIILALLPFVMYLYVGNSGYAGYPWNSFDDMYTDLFLHGKMAVFLVLSLVLAVAVIASLIKMKREERKKVLLRFLPLLLYGLLVIASTVASTEKQIAVYGAMDGKEPIFVLLGYVVVALYAYLTIESEEDIRSLLTAALIGGTCMALLGVLQAVGADPLLNRGIQNLIAGKSYIKQNGTFTLKFPEGMAYGTLYNPNYVGTYVAMYTPLLLAGIAVYKDTWKKIVCGASVLGLLIMLFASQSRTGLIAVAAVAVVAAVFLGRTLVKRWYVIIPGVLLVAGAFLVIDANQDFLMVSRFKELLSLSPSTDPVQGVDTTGNGVRVLYKDTEFTVQMPEDGNEVIYVAFEGNEELPVLNEDDKTYGYITLSNGDEIEIQTAVFENQYAFGLVINGRNFYFTNRLVKNNYKYINEMGRLDECTIPENVFPGYETVGSGRGYVLGRTIPLLKEYIFIGSGPDTFALAFPQNDYVARYRCGFENAIFTRPHNFYLQMGIQTGVISLVAFLVFYAMYFVDSCKKYFFRKYEGMEDRTGFALFLCTIGFMAAGLANDSLIAVTPVFYVLLGAGMAVNKNLNVKRKGK